jgi:hypothetical protein
VSAEVSTPPFASIRTRLLASQPGVDRERHMTLPARRLVVLAPAALIAALMAPMVLTGSTFGSDWASHLWLIQMQADNIRSLGHPSLFFQSGLGGFEPWYAFYGGTLYSLVAAVAVASGGHTLAAYILSFALTMAMVFGGFTWIARQAGLRGWVAYVSGFFFLTSAYYMTDIYARGAWAETVATSAIPLVIAGALALLRADSWRVGPVLAFVFAVVIFSGSHNITLLYGCIFLLVVGVTGLLAAGRAWLPASRRAAAVAGLGVLAVGINLWFLLPNIAYEKNTTIGHSFTNPPKITGEIPLGMLLDPLRFSIPEHVTFDLQLPTLALLWSIVSLALCWRSLAPVWRRLAGASIVTGLVFVAPILAPEIWHAVPRILWSLQFPYRLLPYVDFCVVALVMIAVIALIRRGRTAVTAMLVVAGVLIAAFEMGQATVQEWDTPSFLASRSEIFPGGSRVPSLWTRVVTYHQYQDESLPLVSATISEIPGVTQYNGEGENVISVRAAEEIESSYTLTFTPPKSGTINTNILTGPYLVGVKGAKIVGRSPNQFMVIAVKKEPDGRPTRVTFGTAGTWPIVLGRWATYLSLLALLALLAVLGWRQLWARDASGSRGRARSSPASAVPPPTS